MWGAERELHHHRQIKPCWFLALQSQNAAHNPVPRFEYPRWSVTLPAFRRVLRRIEVAKAVSFRFHNLNVIASLRVQCVSLRCNTVSVQLSSLFIGIPI